MHGRAHVGSSRTGEHTESVHELQGLHCLVDVTTVYNKKRKPYVK